MTAHSSNKRHAFRLSNCCFIHVLYIIAALLLLSPDVASAQNNFPNRPVKIVVPFAPGGMADITARKIGELLRQKWGQPVVIENKPGAGNIIGMVSVAKSPADGYTLILAPDPAVTTAPLIYSDLPYDPVRDFAPITTVAVLPNGLVVRSDLPVADLKELVNLARRQSLTYGSYGVGTSPHLLIEWFKAAANIDLVHIPYSGAAPAAMALTQKQIDISGFSPGAASPLVEAGTIRMLAVADDKRSTMLPNVPTFAEMGYPQPVARSFFAMYAPAQTPENIVHQLHEDIAAVTKELAGYLASVGYTAIADRPEELAARMRETTILWQPIITKIGLKIR